LRCASPSLCPRLTLLAAFAADPRRDKWDAKAREMFAHAIEIPTVIGPHKVPELAQYLADEYKAGGLGGGRHPRPAL
jgi:hypothetical protein